MFYKMMAGLALVLLPLIINAQECRSDMPESTPTSRFTDQGEGMVLDTRTRLVWKRCSEGQSWDADHSTCIGSVTDYSWQEALDHTQMLNSEGGYGGQVDWRVPNIKELESIVSLHCTNPSRNLQVFPDSVTGRNRSSYWTSTPFAAGSVDQGMAWVVGSGIFGRAKDTSDNIVIRLVRDEN